MEKTKIPKPMQKNNLKGDFSLIEKIKDASLKESASFLILKKVINPRKIIINGDFEENLKKEMGDSFKEKYKDLNWNFSELRKSGKDLGVLNFKLMMIPLKIKVFLSTYGKKDAENILNRIQEIEKELKSNKK